MSQCLLREENVHFVRNCLFGEIYLFSFLKFINFLHCFQREGKGGREMGRERNIGCLSSTCLNQGSNPQSVPRPGVKPATFHSTEQCSNQLSHTGQHKYIYFQLYFIRIIYLTLNLSFRRLILQTQSTKSLVQEDMPRSSIKEFKAKCSMYYQQLSSFSTKCQQKPWSISQQVSRTYTLGQRLSQTVPGLRIFTYTFQGSPLQTQTSADQPAAGWIRADLPMK